MSQLYYYNKIKQTVNVSLQGEDKFTHNTKSTPKMYLNELVDVISLQYTHAGIGHIWIHTAPGNLPYC